MKPCRLIKVKSLRMQALKAFTPDSANLQSSRGHPVNLTLYLTGPHNVPCHDRHDGVWRAAGLDCLLPLRILIKTMTLYAWLGRLTVRRRTFCGPEGQTAVPAGARMAAQGAGHSSGQPLSP